MIIYLGLSNFFCEGVIFFHAAYFFPLLDSFIPFLFLTDLPAAGNLLRVHDHGHNSASQHTDCHDGSHL